MVLARALKKAWARSSAGLSSRRHATPAMPAAVTAQSERRWLSSALNTLLTEPSGPGCWPAMRAALARNTVISRTSFSM